MRLPLVTSLYWEELRLIAHEDENFQNKLIQCFQRGNNFNTWRNFVSMFFYIKKNNSRRKEIYLCEHRQLKNEEKKFIAFVVKKKCVYPRMDMWVCDAPYSWMKLRSPSREEIISRGDESFYFCYYFSEPKNSSWSFHSPKQRHLASVLSDKVEVTALVFNFYSFY